MLGYIDKLARAGRASRVNRLDRKFALVFGLAHLVHEFTDGPVQFRNTSLGESATVQGNRLACVDGERMEAILEIFTILTHRPNHLSGSDDAAARRLVQDGGIGLRGMESS